MLTGCGVQPGSEGSADTTAPPASETTAASDTSDPSDTETTQMPDETTADSAADGGNAGDGQQIAITVSEERYLYDNREISYEELLTLLDCLGDDATVAVTDDQAAQRAYQQLIDALTERKLAYTEAE